MKGHRGAEPQSKVGEQRWEAPLLPGPEQSNHGYGHEKGSAAYKMVRATLRHHTTPSES